MAKLNLKTVNKKNKRPADHLCVGDCDIIVVQIW